MKLKTIALSLCSLFLALLLLTGCAWEFPTPLPDDEGTPSQDETPQDETQPAEDAPYTLIYTSNGDGTKIPSSVTSISANAFKDCSSLSIINYQGTKEQWDSIQKEEGWLTSLSQVTLYDVNMQRIDLK